MLNDYTPSIPLLTASTPDSLIQPLHSFLLSFTMIIFSEVGDKTFLIAALMAMNHPRLVVFTAAFAALIVMTILSAVLGHAVPTLIPKRYTNFLAAVLFLIFGAKMLREGYAIPRSQGVSEEMREVEMELQSKQEQARMTGRRRSSLSPYNLEAGRISPRKTRSNTRLPAPPVSPPSSPDSRSPSPSRRSGFMNALAGINNLCSLLLSPAWVQTFIMTFLGEWGDRSQIATIAMAAGQDYWWVTGGAVSGHAICTAAAVIGGRAIAGRVSLRVGKSNSPLFAYRGSNLLICAFCSDFGRWIRVPGIRHRLFIGSHVRDVNPVDYTKALHRSYHGTIWAGQKGMYSILGWLYSIVYILDSVESRWLGLSGRDHRVWCSLSNHRILIFNFHHCMTSHPFALATSAQSCSDIIPFLSNVNLYSILPVHPVFSTCLSSFRRAHISFTSTKLSIRKCPSPPKPANGSSPTNLPASPPSPGPPKPSPSPPHPSNPPLQTNSSSNSSTSPTTPPNAAGSRLTSIPPASTPPPSNSTTP